MRQTWHDPTGLVSGDRLIVLIRSEQRLELLGGYGPTMQIALRLLTTESLDELDLLDGLHTFRNGAQLERPGERHDCRDHGLRPRVPHQPWAEGPVALEGIARQPRNTAQPGVPRSRAGRS